MPQNGPLVKSRQVAHCAYYLSTPAVDCLNISLRELKVSPVHNSDMHQQITDLKDRELDLGHILSILRLGSERAKYEAKLRHIQERLRVLESRF